VLLQTSSSVFSVNTRGVWILIFLTPTPLLLNIGLEQDMFDFYNEISLRVIQIVTNDGGRGVRSLNLLTPTPLLLNILRLRNILKFWTPIPA